MLFERVPLFSTTRDFFLFCLACGFVLSYTLLLEFNNYKNLTRFDSALVKATVLKQYTKAKLTKTKKKKVYQVLKLKSEKNFSFYISQNKNFPHAVGQKFTLEIWTDKISFYQYFTGFYTYGKVLSTDSDTTLKQRLNRHLSDVHTNQDIANIYQALFTAAPLNKNLQTSFSTLGVSHLLAISGFHLGVLSALLFFLLKRPYSFFQNLYFPYRNSKADMFLAVGSLLFIYLLFLDAPPSLVRSFAMLVVGFVLYDRGIKIISMQTLLTSVILLLAFFPQLFFALGFWLSAGGVFYIFLFLIHFKHLSKIAQFLFMPVWVYLLMLPHSLYIFENFGIYHPLSILWTTLFTVFYPLSIFLHIFGLGDLLDAPLLWLLDLSSQANKVSISWHVETLFVLTSLASIRSKRFVWILLLLGSLIFIYSLLQLQ